VRKVPKSSVRQFTAISIAYRHNPANLDSDGGL
jgi:hypothetical protein